MSYADDFLQKAYDDHSIDNRKEIEASVDCGCFACFGTFLAPQVWDWAGGTGFCPYCGMDTVLADGSGFPVTDDKFLRALNIKIFDGPVFWDQIADPHPLTIGVRWEKDKRGTGATGHPIYTDNHAPNQ